MAVDNPPKNDCSIRDQQISRWANIEFVEEMEVYIESQNRIIAY